MWYAVEKGVCHNVLIAKYQMMSTTENVQGAKKWKSQAISTL